MPTEQEVDALIAAIRTETNKEGNTRGRVADTLTAMKDWSKALALFKGSYQNGPKEEGTFWTTADGLWITKQNFTSNVAPTQSNAYWGMVAGGGGKLTSNIPVKLSGGRTLGKIASGQVAEVAGMTVQQAFEYLAIEFIEAALSFTLSQSVFEQGSTATFTASASVAPNSETAISGRRLLKKEAGETEFTEVSSLTAGLSWKFDLSTSKTTVYRFEFIAGNNGSPKTIAVERTISTDLYHRFGPYTGLLTEAGELTPEAVRALGGTLFKSAGNSFTLNTGNVAKRFVICLAPGETLQQVEDADNLYMNITAEYTLINSNFSALDAAGVLVPGHKLYIKTQGVPYSSNKRHNAIIG